MTSRACQWEDAIPGSAIAVVSCDQSYLDRVDKLLANEGYQTILWADGKHAFEMICREQPALVLLDLWLEHPQAGEMVLALMRLTPATRPIPVILCTSDPQFSHEKAGLFRETHCEIMLHPIPQRDLLARIRVMVAKERMASADQSTRPRCSG